MCVYIVHAPVEPVYKYTTVNGLNFLTLFSFGFLINGSLSGLELTKCLSEQQTGKTLIRLLPQKQSDLGLHCLSRPFWQPMSVCHFRSSTIYLHIY